ncbi:MAG: DNA mismatch repair endonuclease MutL [Lentisphaerae bacterium]|nr:DNA mismatch repair endonuclease MutL [Lentisphaerota bacterium]
MPKQSCARILGLMVADSHIRVLPVHVANKIAAGEVVERPVSVAKELIENSIDAGASQIDVEISAGGKKLISVRDNGSGMVRDDAILSIERQATSKIRDVDDIENIHTMGFRGEALAAVASVSRFRLATCRIGEVVGTELLVTGGKIQDVKDIGMPVGTTVEVRDLFFNVPARKKFLRTYQTELTHLRSGFIIQALAHPDLGMSLTIDGQETYRLIADAGLKNRISDLFGPNYLKNFAQVDYSGNGIRVSGYVSAPAFSRSDHNEQYLFVNSRPASAPVLGFALKEGYHTLLPARRYPSVFLFVEMDPGLVDVNVHPTKKEVRFRNPTEVRDSAIAAIHKALSGSADQTVRGSQISSDFTLPRAAETQLRIENLPATRAFQYPRRPFTFSDVEQSRVVQTDNAPEASRDLTNPDTVLWTWCRVVGQIGGLYVVLETEEGLVLMDPHAAHERVLFEKFMDDMTNGKVNVQGLLFPQTVELPAKDAACVRKHLELLETMGFGISTFGGDSFVIDALPAHFAGASAKSFLPEIVQALEESGARNAKGRWREESIARAACKAAVKANDKLTLEEIEKLVADLAAAKMPYTCPHGRPTLIITSFRELNRKFGRT